MRSEVKTQMMHRADDIMSSSAVAKHYEPFERALLVAVVLAFADEWDDCTFSAVMSKSADLRKFFFNCVRHHWARNREGEVTPCSYTDAAIRCPFDDDSMAKLIHSFEASFGPIWKPEKAVARAS